VNKKLVDYIHRKKCYEDRVRLLSMKKQYFIDSYRHNMNI